MCCLAKCLLGVVFGWAIFFINLAAAGSLLAGAFAPWIQYSGSLASVDLRFLINGLGCVGLVTSGSLPSLPSLVTLKDISAALEAANGADASVAWTAASLNAMYLGVGAQVAAAAFILFFVLLNAVTCLCTMLCCCCPRHPRVSALVAVAKAGVAFIGVSRGARRPGARWQFAARSLPAHCPRPRRLSPWARR